MKCPRCGKIITAGAVQCRHCRVHIVRPSDKIVRKMTVNSRIAVACGGLLLFMGAAALMAAAYPLGLFLAVVGGTFIVIGKMMG
jgi:ribosomal protein L40E